MRAVFERHPGDRLTRGMYFDLKTYLPDHVLAKVDSASMSVSLEVRVPFLDFRVVEFAGRVPSGLKVRNGGKWLLKRVAATLLPDGLVGQEKIGFDPPLSAWIFDAHNQAVLDALSRPSARFREVLDGAIVDRWIRTLRGGARWRVPLRSALWAIYQLDRWLQGERSTQARVSGAVARRRSL
jgi:asparagine synthase (glutamine-hydrolysing)